MCDDAALTWSAEAVNGGFGGPHHPHRHHHDHPHCCHYHQHDGQRHPNRQAFHHHYEQQLRRRLMQGKERKVHKLTDSPQCQNTTPSF